MPSSSNQPSLPTATIVPGQRQVQVLPPNHISTNETNQIQQKQVGTGELRFSFPSHISFLFFCIVQITSNDYRHLRTVPHQQQTTTPSNTTATTTTNPSPTPTNLQLRTQNYQRNQAQVCLHLFEFFSNNHNLEINIGSCISYSRSSYPTSNFSKISTATIPTTIYNSTYIINYTTSSWLSYSIPRKTSHTIHCTYNKSIKFSIHSTLFFL